MKVHFFGCPEKLGLGPPLAPLYNPSELYIFLCPATHKYTLTTGVKTFSLCVWLRDLCVAAVWPPYYKWDHSSRCKKLTRVVLYLNVIFTSISLYPLFSTCWNIICPSLSSPISKTNKHMSSYALLKTCMAWITSHAAVYILGNGHSNLHHTLVRRVRNTLERGQ